METIIGTSFQIIIGLFIAVAAVAVILMIVTGLFQAFNLCIRLFLRIIGKPLHEEQATNEEGGFWGALFEGLGLRPKMKFEFRAEDLRRNPA
jgi:hypothetical protein